MKKNLLVISCILLLVACSRKNYSERTFFNKVYESPPYDLFGSNRFEFYSDTTFLFIKKDGPANMSSKGKWIYDPKNRIIVLKLAIKSDTTLQHNINPQTPTANNFIDVTGQKIEVINSKKLSLQGIKYLQQSK